MVNLAAICHCHVKKTVRTWTKKWIFYHSNFTWNHLWKIPLVTASVEIYVKAILTSEILAKKVPMAEKWRPMASFSFEVRSRTKISWNQKTFWKLEKLRSDLREIMWRNFKEPQSVKIFREKLLDQINLFWGSNCWRRFQGWTLRAQKFAKKKVLSTS